MATADNQVLGAVMNNDEVFCAAMADAEDVPDRQRVPRKARGSIAKAAMVFVRDHGSEYPDKESALEAFKEQYLRDRQRVGGKYKMGETQVVGFGILTAILINLLTWFFQRWWARTFPNT